MDFENDILKAEEKLISEFGFVKEEINFLMKHKPTFILFDHPEFKGKDDGNIRIVHEVFVKKLGYSDELFRTLVVKYPFILSKNEE